MLRKSTSPRSLGARWGRALPPPLHTGHTAGDPVGAAHTADGPLQANTVRAVVRNAHAQHLVGETKNYLVQDRQAPSQKMMADDGLHLADYF